MQKVEVVEESGRRGFGPREKLRRGDGEDRHRPGHATRYRPRCAGVLILVGCWAVLMSAMAGPLAASAIAGPARYVLDKCDSELPGGSVQGAVFTGPRPFAGAQDCNLPGGSIFVVQQGEAAWSSAQWSLPLPPPPGGYTESVTVTGSMCNGAQADSGTVAFAAGPAGRSPAARRPIPIRSTPPPGASASSTSAAKGSAPANRRPGPRTSRPWRSTRWRRSCRASGAR